MFVVPLLALAVAQPPAGANELGSSRDLNGVPEMTQVSLKKALGGPREQFSVTDMVSNHVTGSSLVFTIAGWAKGTVPQAKDGGSVLTMVRTTYRPVTAAYPQFVDDLPGLGGHYEQQCGVWLESGREVTAFPGGKLEAKLIDGGEKGKVLVRCASEVTGDRDKGYTYTYTVENLTDKPISFRWADLEGKVAPGKTYTKSEPSKKLTVEKSDLLTIETQNGSEFAVRANVWARPK
jgi:hypothetical protein